jgi:hypothetical protein
VEFGLSKSEARKQAKALARAREKMLRDRDRRRLQSLRAQLKEAKSRRSVALKRARQLCRSAKARVRAQVRELRAAERQRLNSLVTRLRTNERAACRARKARVRAAGGSVAERRRQLLLEEQRTQRLLRSAEQSAARQVRSTSTERRQESDERVRNNLPAELRKLWDRFKGGFRDTKRATRTEAFLEWAEANPEEVLRIQSDDADRDVARLVRQREGLERKLARKHSYDTCPDDVATLTAMGLAPSQTVARRKAAALSMPPPF